MAITWQGISATGYLMPLLLALAAPEVGPASQSLLHASSLTSRCGERASGSFSFPSPPQRFTKRHVLPTPQSLQLLGGQKRELYTTGGSQQTAMLAKMDSFLICLRRGLGKRHTPCSEAGRECDSDRVKRKQKWQVGKSKTNFCILPLRWFSSSSYTCGHREAVGGLFYAEQGMKVE